MSPKHFKIFIFIGILCFLAFFYQRIKEQAVSFQEMPKTIANFRAYNTEGSKTSYQAEKGTATMIVLSASWCPSCKTELKDLLSIHEEFSDKGLKIIMVDEDENFEDGKNFKKKYNMPWVMVHWNYDTMNALGNPNVIPVTFVVDEKDSIQRVDVGTLNVIQVRHEIKRILKL